MKFMALAKMAGWNMDWFGTGNGIAIAFDFDVCNESVLECDEHLIS